MNLKINKEQKDDEMPIIASDNSTQIDDINSLKPKTGGIKSLEDLEFVSGENREEYKTKGSDKDYIDNLMKDLNSNNTNNENLNNDNNFVQIETTEKERKEIGIKTRKIIRIPWQVIVIAILALLIWNPIKISPIENVKNITVSKCNDIYHMVKNKIRLYTLMSKYNTLINVEEDDFTNYSIYGTDDDDKLVFSMDISDPNKDYYMIFEFKNKLEDQERQSLINKLSKSLNAEDITSNNENKINLKLNIYDDNVIYNYETDNDCCIVKIGGFEDKGNYKIIMNSSFKDFEKYFLNNDVKLTVRAEL